MARPAELILLPDYIGKDTDRNQSERLAATHVKEVDLHRENALYQTKWWDYRRLHHTETTWLFTEFYREAVKRAHKKHFDRIEGIERKGIGTKELFNRSQSQITALWRARQVADIYGIPYGLFCSFAMNALLDWRVWKDTPKPSMLYNRGVVEAVTQKWDAMKRSRMTLAKDPFFLVENYEEHQDQDAYQEWIGR